MTEPNLMLTALAHGSSCGNGRTSVWRDDRRITFGDPAGVYGKRVCLEEPQRYPAVSLPTLVEQVRFLLGCSSSEAGP